MAITLLEAKKNVQDALQMGVIDEFRKGSLFYWVFQHLLNSFPYLLTKLKLHLFCLNLDETKISVMMKSNFTFRQRIEAWVHQYESGAAEQAMKLSERGTTEALSGTDALGLGAGRISLRLSRQKP